MRPIMDYAAFVWSPHTTNNINKLEAIQRRAARYVMSNYNKYSSMSNMLATLNWKSLKQRRDIQSLTILHVQDTVRNGLADVVLPNCLIPNRLATRGHNKKFHQISFEVDAFKFSYYPRVIPIWNGLPEYNIIVNAPTMDIFNNFIKFNCIYLLYYTHSHKLKVLQLP